MTIKQHRHVVLTKMILAMYAVLSGLIKLMRRWVEKPCKIISSRKVFKHGLLVSVSFIGIVKVLSETRQDGMRLTTYGLIKLNF